MTEVKKKQKMIAQLARCGTQATAKGNQFCLYPSARALALTDSWQPPNNMVVAVKQKMENKVEMSVTPES